MSGAAMVSDPTTLEIGLLNTHLICAPYAERVSVPERLEAINLCVKSLRQIIKSDWQEDPHNPRHLPDLLKGAWLVASRPTLVKLTCGYRPDYATADEVHKNNQALAGKLILDRLTASPSDRMRGALSEFSISALLTWGVATRHVREGSYSLPATPTQDSSTAVGLRDGFDLVFRTPRRRYPIQSKSSKPLATSERPYLPGITVVCPSELLDEPQAECGAHDLLHALTTDDQDTLGEALAKLQAKFDATEAAVRQERESGGNYIKIAV